MKPGDDSVPKGKVVVTTDVVLHHVRAAMPYTLKLWDDAPKQGILPYEIGIALAMVLQRLAKEYEWDIPDLFRLLDELEEIAQDEIATMKSAIEALVSAARPRRGD